MIKRLLIILISVLSLSSEEILKESFEYEPGLIFDRKSQRKLTPKWGVSVQESLRTPWKTVNDSELTINSKQRLTSHGDNLKSWFGIAIPPLLDKKILTISLRFELGNISRDVESSPSFSFGLTGKLSPLDFSAKGNVGMQQFFYYLTSAKHATNSKEIFLYQIFAGNLENKPKKEASWRYYSIHEEGNLAQFRINLKDRTYTASFDDEIFNENKVPEEIAFDQLTYFTIRFSNPVPDFEENCTWIDDVTISAE